MPQLSALAIKLLMARRTLDILEISTEDARTVKEIADNLGKGVEQVWHHVRKLVQADILSEVGFRKRAGRAQKLYKASATQFYVPADIRTTTVGRELERKLRTSIEYQDHAIGELFSYDGTRWRVEDIYENDATSEQKQHELWFIANLSAGQRDDLQREVMALFKTYTQNQAASANRSIVRFACAVLPPELS